MINPYGQRPDASWVGPPRESMGGGMPDSLEERRRQLLEFLSGRGVSGLGFRGLPSVRSGGAGGRAGLPQMTYNPFLSQIAGRAGENFPELPQGISQQAAAAAQLGPPPVMGGGPGMGAPSMGGTPPNPIAGVPQAIPGQQAQAAGGGRTWLGGADPAAAPVYDPWAIGAFSTSRLGRASGGNVRAM